MKVLSLLALVITIAGWVLTIVTGTALLSGPYEDRTCQTECVQNLFFSGLGATLSGLVLTLVALTRGGKHALAYSALALAVPLFAIYATLIVTGNFA